MTQVSSTQFDVTFNTVTTPGSYSFSAGPNILDLAGNAMDQNSNGTNGEAGDAFAASFTVAPPTQTFTNNTHVTIRDLATVTSTITINQDITIADLNAQINLTHTWDSDLVITLQSPGGKSVTLANRRGGSGDNYTNTVFDGEALTPISAGVAPFAGAYRPEGLLSAFDNTNARGTWTLSIRDAARSDVGTLLSWSITIGSGGAGGSSVGGSPGRGLFHVPFLGAGVLTSSSANSSAGSLPAAPAAATHAAGAYLALLGGQSHGHASADVLARVTARLLENHSFDLASFHGGIFVGSSAAGAIGVLELGLIQN